MLTALFLLVNGLSVEQRCNQYNRNEEHVLQPFVTSVAELAESHNLGAIISAACFGAQACFYSDVTLMSASACRINNVDYDHHRG